MEVKLRKLCEEVRELSLGTSGEIERLDGPPSPLRFLRDFVLPNKPCIIANAIDSWPALTAWTNAYLVRLLRDQTVSVHLTPDGRADSPVNLHRASSVFGCSVVPSKSQVPSRLNRNGSSECSFTKQKRHNSPECLMGMDAKFADKQGNNVVDRYRDDEADPIADHSGNGVVNTTKTQNSFNVRHPVDDVQYNDALGNDVKHGDSGGHIGDCNTFGKHQRASYNVKDDLVNFPRDGINAGIGIVDVIYHQSPAFYDRNNFQEASNHSRNDVSSAANNAVSSFHSLPTQQAGYRNTERPAELCPSLPDHTGDCRNLDEEFWFATAHVERLPFPKALELILGSGSGNMIAYAQEQNGSFLSEYSILINDADVHIPWATEALGCMPEAVNFWIGTEKSVTSFHKDHYENLYAVVCGEKHFTLLPPTDVHRLYVRDYPSAHYSMHGDKFVLEQDKPSFSVPWVSVDPYPPPEEVSRAQSHFPEYFNGAKPFKCTVRAGELLYLPSMWFHHVRQSPDDEGRTIAVNFWYDMQFDIKYAYYNFVESLIRKS